MVSISTYGGWAGIVLVGAGYWYLQSRRTVARPGRSAPLKQANKSGDGRKDGKSKKHPVEGVQSSGEQGTSSQEKGQKKKKQKFAQSTVEDTIPIITAAVEEVKDDEELNNQEFARRFQKAKSGTIPTSRSVAGSRQKSVKQSKAMDTSASIDIFAAQASSNNVSNASSSAGVDGDDDLSEANSPPLEATRMKTLRGGDVSDMLESSSASPSILRITEPTTPSQPKKDRKPVSSSEPTETKKQRQNRKKAEAKKEVREEQEKERRVLLEKQRRTAREAEGRAAKDGSSFMAAKSPASSVWSAPPTSTIGRTAPKVDEFELLDTYEPITNGASKSSIPTAGNKKAASEWENKTIPSEEEQMRLLEEETAWNTVTSKKGKKKGAEPDQIQASLVIENNNVGAKPMEAIPTNGNSRHRSSITIVGDPNIDLSNYSYNGGPVNAVLENGDGQKYGYTMADDEWEVS